MWLFLPLSLLFFLTVFLATRSYRNVVGINGKINKCSVLDVFFEKKPRRFLSRTFLQCPSILCVNRDRCDTGNRIFFLFSPVTGEGLFLSGMKMSSPSSVENLRRIGVGNFWTGCLCVVLQVAGKQFEPILSRQFLCSFAFYPIINNKKTNDFLQSRWTSQNIYFFKVKRDIVCHHCENSNYYDNFNDSQLTNRLLFSIIPNVYKVQERMLNFRSLLKFFWKKNSDKQTDA